MKLYFLPLLSLGSESGNRVHVLSEDIPASGGDTERIIWRLSHLSQKFECMHILTSDLIIIIDIHK